MHYLQNFIIENSFKNNFRIYKMERNREFEKKSLFLFLKNKYTHSYTNEKDMVFYFIIQVTWKGRS